MCDTAALPSYKFRPKKKATRERDEQPTLLLPLTDTHPSITARQKLQASRGFVMQVGNYADLDSDTDLAGGRSKELLFLLQVLSFGSQGLLLRVLLTPQVAGRTQTITHSETYVTRKSRARNEAMKKNRRVTERNRRELGPLD